MDSEFCPSAVLDSQVPSDKQSKDCDSSEKRLTDAGDKRLHDSGKKSRQVVDSVHLATLSASYAIHFARYSKDRKQASKQTIPSSVWRLVYKDYIGAHPTSVFTEDTLKGRLRECLEELKTGTSNTEGTGSAVLQCDEFLAKIKDTNGHAVRNILHKRASIIAASSKECTSKRRAETIVEGESNSDREVASSGVNNVISGPSASKIPKLVTKSEMLSTQVQALKQMSSDFTEATNNQREFMISRRRSQKLLNLKLLLDTNVLSQEEFAQQARILMDLS